MAIIYVRSTDGSDADSGATWALAKATINGAKAIAVAGDTIYVSHVHAEVTTGSNLALTFAGTLTSPIKIICVNDGAEPPTASATTATVTQTGNGNTTTINGNVYVEGITFTSGTSTEQGFLSFSSAGGEAQYYKNCNFQVGGSNGSSRVSFGAGPNSANAPTIRWENCSVKFANASQSISFSQTLFEWVGGSILSGSAAITALFLMAANHAGVIDMSGIDLSNGAAAMDIFSGSGGKGVLRDIKTPASWTGSLLTGTAIPGCRYEMYNYGNGATNYKEWFKDFTGELREEVTLVKTSGASDGTVPFSWKIVTSANCNELSGRFKSPPISRWNSTVGSAITVAIDILSDSAVDLTDAEVWLRVEYLSASGTPLGTYVSDHRADMTVNGVGQTTSSATWTTTGMTNPNKQTLSVTFTPQQVGYTRAYVVVGKVSKTLYADPKQLVS